MTQLYMQDGSHVSLEHPQWSRLRITDIAQALSHLCRFNGHTNRFYSVAQHCVHVSEIVPSEFALAGLLHDAHEAYIGDVTSPLKAVLGPEYRRLDNLWSDAIVYQFNLRDAGPTCWEEVYKADMVLLATERRDLLPEVKVPWDCLFGVEPRERKIHPWSAEMAYNAFLRRYIELTGAELQWKPKRLT